MDFNDQKKVTSEISLGFTNRGLAVEFDMYRNPDLGELSGNHISVHVPPRKGGLLGEEMRDEMSS